MESIPLSAQYTALGILLLISAVFSIAETSMMALNRYRLKALVRLGNRGAIITTELLARTDRLLGVIPRVTLLAALGNVDTTTSPIPVLEPVTRISDVELDATREGATR